MDYLCVQQRSFREYGSENDSYILYQVMIFEISQALKMAKKI